MGTHVLTGLFLVGPFGPRVRAVGDAEDERVGRPAQQVATGMGR
ncbi:hypothetical protein SAMN05660350_04490 [Geodermatophilus obscurus]|uniref:Uncharacterized protein n=1 Tax=Geodermatophilus obscurus TaxID=1861 RepID=A0A1M7UZC8_9ACTN|nr:hypothetical protein SAMN05660350_04490 [Geodermatophilus obscurus]